MSRLSSERNRRGGGDSGQLPVVGDQFQEVSELLDFHTEKRR